MKKILAFLILSAACFGQTVVTGNGAATPYPTCNGSVAPCKVFLTGQTAAIGSTTIYTPSAAGLYRISAFLTITVAGTGTSVQPVIDYNDGTSNLTDTGGSAALSLGSKGELSNNTVIVGSGQAIKYRVSFNSVSVAPTYQVAFVVEKLY